MVEINSWEPGINSSEKNLYLRTINEFRIEFENNVLFFLMYLRSFGKKRINSIYLKSELHYLNKICKRYHVKEINPKVNPEKSDEYIDSILLLIKKSRKIIDYSYLDMADFYFEHPGEFSKIKINKNISIILREVLTRYHKSIPRKILYSPSEIPVPKRDALKNVNENAINKILKRFSEDLKISVDKMFLKVYDYFVETDIKIINSPKTFFLLKDFKRIGKKYSKYKFKIKIRNKKPKNSSDIFLEEISANLHRAKEISS